MGKNPNFLRGKTPLFFESFTVNEKNMFQKN